MTYEYWDIHSAEPLDDDELYRRFDDFLDEMQEVITILGMTYDPSAVLRETDPIAYQCLFNDWLDGELGETIADTNSEDPDLQEMTDKDWADLSEYVEYLNSKAKAKAKAKD